MFQNTGSNKKRMKMNHPIRKDDDRSTSFIPRTERGDDRGNKHNTKHTFL